MKSPSRVDRGTPPDRGCRMADIPRSDPRLDEERLAHALISRGLLTREEAQRLPRQFRAAASAPRRCWPASPLAGALTAGQAQRAKEELSTLLGQQIPGYHLHGKARPGGDGRRLQGAAGQHGPAGGRQAAASASWRPTRSFCSG